jgi:hypothetical protein
MKDRPWIWIIVAFVIMFIAMTVTIIIAEKNAPQSVPLEHHGH